MTTMANFLLSGLKRWRLCTFVTFLDGHAFPRLEWLLLSILPILCIIGLLLASRKRSTEKIYCTLSPDAARALSAILTPSSGGWSSHLVTYFRRTSSSSQSIQLDLSELLLNIFAGHIELRDTGDLFNLLQGPLYIYDFSITISVSRPWWFIAAKLVLLQQFHMSPVPYFMSYSRIQYAQRVKIPASPSEEFTYDLDHTPCQRIEREVLRIQQTHPSGTTFSIEFTCFAPGISIVSPDYILCLLPFLYASGSQHNITSRNFPSTLSLQKVIGWLSNDYGTILSVANVSSEQAAILCEQEKDMVYNCNLRNRLVSGEGLVGWRRKRFMLQWEAGLLSAGLLFRWHIILKPN